MHLNLELFQLVIALGSLEIFPLHILHLQCHVTFLEYRRAASPCLKIAHFSFCFRERDDLLEIWLGYHCQRSFLCRS